MAKNLQKECFLLIYWNLNGLSTHPCENFGQMGEKLI